VEATRLKEIINLLFVQSMKKTFLPLIINFIAILLAACNSTSSINAERETVKSEEITDTFKVAVYETRYTFKYLISKLKRN
jgi:hypothetical protein